MRVQNKKQAGFTIVEFLVYLAILVLVMAASVSFLFSLNSVVTQYRLETELYRGGTAAIEQIVLALRQAESFEIGSSVTYPSTSGALAVSNTQTTQFARVGTDLELTIDGTSYGDVTSDVISVQSFVVHRYVTTNGEFVRIELTLQANIAGVSRTETFYGGSVLRGAL